MPNIQKREITVELRESYLDYAMSVIVSRALPDVRDGLKPVQRRILWDMWDSGLTHEAKFRKSANVIGQVLARYHPHGDASVYDTTVRMAQGFSLRYPLIEGQGNFGSIDGDSPAAYRYTEARLSKIAAEMLRDIEKQTVPWVPNYDATREEPTVLPARLPNLLVNGATGIAVGMATSIPPHNLGEICDALVYLAEHDDATNEDLMRFIKGPDFPTGAVMFDRKAIADAYATGRGPVTVRAKAEIVERKNRQFDIVVTEIPYQVNKAELVKHIAKLVQEKKIDGIRDLRDESDREGMRIVIELKNDVPPQKVLNQLYLHTDLEKNFNFNMIALVGGLEPQLLSLRELLLAYFEHRKQVVRRRTEFDLSRAKERAHILEGLVKALGAIDEVIKTIKRSKDRDDAYRNLVAKFRLTDPQATAILEMRLQTLAALEREKIQAELKEKKALIENLMLILKHPKKIVELIVSEVRELKEKYGDARKTQVVPTPVGTFNAEDLIPQEDAVITLSSGGYIKRLPPTVFRAQRRGGKGLIGSEVADEDFLAHFAAGKTHDNLLFFTDRGRVFQTKVHEIPPASRTSKGRAIHNFLELPAEENVAAIVAYGASTQTYEDSTQTDAEKSQRKSAKTPPNSAFLVMATRNGRIKRTPLADFANIRRTGIIAIALQKGDSLVGATLSSGRGHVVMTTERGQAIRFRETTVRAMGRTAAGVTGIRLRSNDRVAAFSVVPEEKSSHATAQSRGDATGKARAAGARLFVVMANGFGKQTPLKEYKVQNRGGSGVKTAIVTPKTGLIVAAHIVTEETDILALSSKGQVVRTKLAQVRITGRHAQGVRIMHLKTGDKIAGVVVL